MMLELGLGMKLGDAGRCDLELNASGLRLRTYLDLNYNLDLNPKSDPDPDPDPDPNLSGFLPGYVPVPSL